MNHNITNKINFKIIICFLLILILGFILIFRNNIQENYLFELGESDLDSVNVTKITCAKSDNSNSTIFQKSFNKKQLNNTNPMFINNNDANFYQKD